MKKLVTVAIMAFVMAAYAQEGEAPTKPWYKDWLSFSQRVSEAGGLTAAVYPGYAPDLRIDGERKPWGGGMALLYPVTDYGFVGGRIDYLGDQFWAPSATLGLKASFQLFGKTVTPFAYGGVIVPVGGAGDQNGEVGAIVGGGLKATILAFWKDSEGLPKGTLDLFYATEHWTLFEGLIHRPGVALSVRF